MPATKPARVSITVRLRTPKAKSLKMFAVKRGTSIQRLLETAVDQILAGAKR